MEAAEAKSRCRKREGICSKGHLDAKLQSSSSSSVESCESRTTDHLTHGGQKRKERNDQVQ